MKKNFIIAGLLVAGMYSAQQAGSVGINVEPVGATLDVQIDKSTGYNKTLGQGVAVPRVTKQELSEMTGAIAEGALVYVNTIGNVTGTATTRVEDVTTANGVGFYYFNKTKWVKVGGGANTTATESGTFTRNFREDNRTSVVVDQNQDGSPITDANKKDYFIALTGNATTFTFPVSASANKGRIICIYQQSETESVNFKPDNVTVGGQNGAMGAGNTVCFISGGNGKWYNTSGY